MPSALARLDPSRPPLRWLLRAPDLLYRVGLGWLLGERFVQLTVRGRRSGLPRRVVLEVIGESASAGGLLVASAWGRRAQWLRNVEVRPEVEVRVGRRRYRAEIRGVSELAARDALRAYAEAHPWAYRWCIGPLLLGHRPRGALDEFTGLARTIPVLVVRAST